MDGTAREKPLGPLDGLRVLDLTTFLSGPFCTQILADLGAEVIKVEHPDGDMTRHIPPYFVGHDSAYFLSTNRNKKSIAVDLKSRAGSDLIIQLAAKSDILIENFRPGVATKLGISYHRVTSTNKRLIWCSVTGFGQDGPYRDRPAYDMVIQAMAGVMSLTGEPGRPGVRTGIPLSDLTSGMYAAIAILAAVLERERSGFGQEIDISLLDSVISLLSYQGVYHLVSGTVPGRQGRGHDSIATYRTFRAGDGESVAVTANTERMWRELCSVLGKQELADDERFSSLKLRYENRQQLWRILARRFRSRPAKEWAEMLTDRGVPAAIVATVDSTLQDPQVLGRDMVIKLQGPSNREVRLLGNPIKMSRTNRMKHSYPPMLGADTTSVLTDVLGLTASAIADLGRAGVIKHAQPEVGGSDSIPTELA